jgi:hypothetical protein
VSTKQEVKDIFTQIGGMQYVAWLYLNSGNPAGALEYIKQAGEMTHKGLAAVDALEESQPVYWDDDNIWHDNVATGG